MSAVKKTISVDEKLVSGARNISSNFSAVVEAALVEYLQRHRIKKAIQSFGKWDKREQTSVDIVNLLRHDDDRTSR